MLYYPYCHSTTHLLWEKCPTKSFKFRIQKILPIVVETEALFYGHKQNTVFLKENTTGHPTWHAIEAVDAILS